jgi:hypothetical protein
MKKIVLVVLLLAAAYAAYKFWWSKSDEQIGGTKQEALTISKNSAAFNASFEKLFTSYNDLKTAFVNYDTTAIAKTGKDLMLANDSLLIRELKADTFLIQTAKANVESLHGDIVGLLGETVMEEKKRGFQMVSQHLLDLIRIVKYDKQKMYIQKCPMAFNDAEAAEWLSLDTIIVNPYLGKQHPKYKNTMLGCGEVVDTISYMEVKVDSSAAKK